MRILRAIISIGLFVCLPGALVLGRPSLDAAVDRQVTQAQVRAAKTAKTAPVKKSASGLTQRQQQIKAALDKARLKLDDSDIADHVLSWSEFNEINRIETAVAQRRLEVWNQLKKKTAEIFTQDMAEDMQKAGVVTVEEKRPDYGKETKGIAVIYLTDASGHGTQTIVNEVKEVMRSVRAANPQARILLATEMAYLTDFDTPIQFAGKTNKNMGTFKDTVSLLSQASRLGVDVLGLDDSVFWKGDGGIWYKIGNRLLYLPASEEEFKEKFSSIVGFVGASTLGMKLRNEQWVSYIRAVKPFYDIVIVYAGDGHIDSDLPFLDVPFLLGEEHAIFNFYTTERNKVQDEFTVKTYQMLCDTNACVMVPVEPESEPEDSQEAIEWDEKSFLYQKYDVNAGTKYMKTLPAEKQAQWNAIIKESEQAGFKEAGLKLDFTVYLPDVTQK